MLAEDKFVFQGDGGLATNAADLVKVALIVTEQVSVPGHLARRLACHSRSVLGSFQVRSPRLSDGILGMEKGSRS